ncbi:PREDICTED: taste receptor type 2 member 140-like [Chinchilla lanigera]|uniref:taste receptor type 2 member 140-like n=1 Tax=Chinchilla lanigera TaxID=34839 RepID=UPI00038EE219|nr:PREDICTED: taste receptor type 2 member 140-like [Chinchilla lanigera]
MSEFMQYTFMLILNVEFIIGNLGNCFITLVNFIVWVKRRKLSLFDQILTTLAIFRISFLWSAAICILAIFYPGLLTETMKKITGIIWTVSSHFNIWLTACLNIFYFLKIANFSKSIFLFLKWRVKQVVSLTFLVSLVFLPLHVTLTNPHLDTWIDGYKRNMSYTSNLIDSTQVWKKVLFSNSIFAFIPLTVSLPTFLLLIFSLWKHLKRMQYNARGSRDVSTKAHIKALQTIVAFLLLYIIVSISFIVQILSYELLEKKFMFLFRQVTIFAFPSGHSCVVILGNKKLRQVSFSLFQWLRCRSKNMESSAPK